MTYETEIPDHYYHSMADGSEGEGGFLGALISQKILNTPL